MTSLSAQAVAKQLGDIPINSEKLQAEIQGGQNTVGLIHAPPTISPNI